MFEQFAYFAAAALVVIAAPGPDNLGTLSIGLSRGRGPAIAFGLGCALGCLTHTLWAAAGITALIAASPIAFNVFKIAGAIYLFYLGVLALRSKGVASLEGDDIIRADPTRPSRYLARGFIANAINPKVALFFLAFLPQFIRADGSSKAVQMIQLGTGFALLTAVAFGTLGFFAGQIGGWLRGRPAIGRRLDQLTGILFIGLGVRLLLQRQ